MCDATPLFEISAGLRHKELTTVSQGTIAQLWRASSLGVRLRDRMSTQTDRQEAGTSKLASVGAGKPPEARLDELARDLFRAFVRVDVHEIDNELNQWLKRIVLELDLDRSTLAQIDSASGSASFTHGWARDRDQIIGPPLDANTLLPWFRRRISANETIVFSSPDELPPEAAQDIQNLGHRMPQSNVTIPLRFSGKVFGAVGFSALRHGRQWSQTLVRQLEAIAEILGYALERKREGLETIALRNELEYLSRINTMGLLAAALGHELNQPLAAILSNAEAAEIMLGSDRPDLGEVRAAMVDIVQDTVRASETIRRLGSMFRRQEIKRDVLDPGEVIAEVDHLVQVEALIRNVSFRLETSSTVPKIAGDRIQLQQAVLNLVLNAFDAAAASEGEPREVVLRVVSTDDGSVEISVCDCGSGIDNAARDRIFEPFFTTKPDGTGIGLSITKAIVDSHSGRIRVVPNPDRGVTFQVLLPAIQENG
jgi:signal transduction histidine kinase